MRKMIHEELAGVRGLRQLADLLGLPCIDAGPVDVWAACMAALASRIERDYIPLPRYEDGDAVRFGEEVELHYKSGGCDKGILQAIHVNKGPVWMLSFVGRDHELLYRYDSTCDVLRRPAPKALSADGKELGEGVTVWVTPEHRGDCGKGNAALGGMAGLCGHEYGEAVEVRKVVSGGNVMLRTKSRAWCPASWLTTEEPDSLKKAMERFQGILEDHNGLAPETEDELWEVHSRLTALIERIA